MVGLKYQASMTFSRALNPESRWNDWNTVPTNELRSRARWASDNVAASRPPASTWPRVGCRSSDSTETRVDFPEPERPTTDVVVRGRISKVTPRSAGTSCSPAR